MRFLHTALVMTLSVLMIGGVAGVAVAASHAAAPQKKQGEQPATGKAAPTAAEKTSRHAGTVKAVDAAGRMLTVAEKSGSGQGNARGRQTGSAQGPCYYRA